jgi:hypothetical protein
MMKDAGSYLDYLDDATWQRLVGALLNSHGAEILSRHSKRSSQVSVRARVFTGLRVRPQQVVGDLSSGPWWSKYSPSTR